MKKLIIACLLATSAASAFAEWLEVYHQDGGSTYIETFTVKYDSNLPIVWMLVNYSSRSPWGELSSIRYTEFDCKEKRYRTLSSIGYSDPMAKGRVTSDTSGPSRAFVSDWNPVGLNNMIEPVLKIVCAKKP